METEINDGTLRVYLESLGRTPDEVADTLRTQGVKGQPFNAQSCPITNSIKRQFPGPHLVSTGASLASIFSDETSEPVYSAQVDLPIAVEEFVKRFDNRAYEDLEERC